jgi:hypothetical protein
VHVVDVRELPGRGIPHTTAVLSHKNYTSQCWSYGVENKACGEPSGWEWSIQLCRLDHHLVVHATRP